MKKGFTLIELLVVVLIIGILSAIALPQYQKAVEKAKVIKMLPLYRHVIEAVKAYDLANGKSLPPNFDALGPILPNDWTGTDTNKATSSNGEWHMYFSTDNVHGWRYIELKHLTGTYAGGGFIYLVRDSGQQHNSFPNRLEIVCCERSSMSTGQGGFCKKIFGGKYIGDNGNYLYTFPY